MTSQDTDKSTFKLSDEELINDNGENLLKQVYEANIRLAYSYFHPEESFDLEMVIAWLKMGVEAHHGKSQRVLAQAYVIAGDDAMGEVYYIEAIANGERCHDNLSIIKARKGDFEGAYNLISM